MLKLTITALKETIELNQTRLTIGRDQSNSICLDNSDISGFHAEVHCESDAVFLVDLGSSNGTFINGKPLLGRQQLKAWDKVKFASLEAEVIDSIGRRPTQVNPAITEADIANAVKQSVQSSSPTVSQNAKTDWQLMGSKGSFPLSSNTSIGRENADVVIASPNISRKHAQVTINGGMATLKDLGSANGTFVNGNRITEQIIKNGDKVKFDIEEFTVKGPVDSSVTQIRPAVSSVDNGATQVRTSITPNKTATRPASSATKTVTGIRVSPSISPKLEILKGAPTKTINLGNKQYSVGRTDVNDIVLSSDSVSSQHAKLEQFDDAWKLTDSGSTNGTYVNGKRITSMVILKSGDQVKFGEVDAIYSDGSAGASANTTKVMPNTTQQISVAKSGLPAWSYGVFGFVIVASLMGYFMFDFGKPPQIEAKLQAGKTWQVQLPKHHGVVATPAVADINNDGFLDVVIGDSRGYITALDGAEGKQIYQAEIPDGIAASIAISDVTGDGNKDVIIASMKGMVSALDHKGQFLWRSDENLNMGSIPNKPALVDVDNDGSIDVIVPTAKRGLVALSGNRGWEIWNTRETTNGVVVNAPIALDINGDGVVDFVTATDKGQITAQSAQQGKAWQLWDVEVGRISMASPAYAKVDGAGFVIVATKNNGVVAIDAASGRIVWNVLDGQEFASSPLVADMNGDGNQDILLTAKNGNTFILDARYGEDINSGNISGEFVATSALFDVTNDDIPELFMHEANGQLLVVDANRLRPEVAVKGTGNLIASPVLADVNNDGLLDVISASTDGLVTAFSLNRITRKGDIVWGGFLGRAD